MQKILFTTSVAAGVVLASIDAALAGVVALPGPVAAVGVPAMLIIGGAFLTVRYLRSRRK